MNFKQFLSKNDQSQDSMRKDTPLCTLQSQVRANNSRKTCSIFTLKMLVITSLLLSGTQVPKVPRDDGTYLCPGVSCSF